MTGLVYHAVMEHLLSNQSLLVMYTDLQILSQVQQNAYVSTESPTVQ